MRPINILILFLFITNLQCSAQPKINGTLMSTHWSPDSSLYVEVYKEKLTMAFPGQGSDHSAIIVLKKSSGEIIHMVDENSSDQILLRDFFSIHWKMDNNILNYAPARYIEWIDEENFNMEIIREKINIYLGYDSWEFYKNPEKYGDKYYRIGEFFGDPDYDFTLDLAVLIKDSTGVVKLLMYEAYNYFHPNDGISLINLKKEYSWVGIFEVVKSDEPIWSNWDEEKGDDGLRELKETPKNEIIYLNHDALFLHAGESCGGGFVFWKDDQWNWRQQE